MASVSLRLPEQISERLQRLADVTGRSKTYYMVEAICEYMDDLEDLYIAQSRSADIRSGKSKTIPIEEIMKKYGVEN